MRSRTNSTPTVPLRARLGNRNRQLLMAVFLQNPRAFLAMKELLKPEHFPSDRGLGLAWSLAQQHYDQNEALPDKDILAGAIEDACDVNPEQLTEPEILELEEFLEWAFNPESFREDIRTSDSYCNWAVNSAQKLLHERLAEKLSKTVAVNDPNMIALDLPAVLDSIRQEASRIEAASVDDLFDTFPDSWDQDLRVETTSTGLSFLDSFLGGGHAPGEVYGLMGPYGSCKTTIATMLAVESALAFWQADSAESTVPPRIAFLVTYESPAKEIRQRSMGYAAKIHRSTMETMRSLEADASRSSSLKDYEKRLFAEQLRAGEAVDGEYERAARMRDILRTYFCHLDFTGNGRRPMGSGGITEIAYVANKVARMRNAACGAIFIDYVGAMAKRQLAAEGGDDNHLRLLVAGAPLEAKNRLALAFQCPVWLLQQFSGEANSRRSGVVLHHTEGAESKSFGENLDFCFTIGVPDPAENVSLLACTKHRRQPPRPPVIIQIDGGMNRVVSADDRYVLNPYARRIMRKEDNAHLPQDRQAPVAAAAAGPNPFM